ncbi:MAG: biotin/lipoyl-containing protein [Candidatus Omnitrophota bacterium]
MVKIVLPELTEGIEKATVSYWYFKAGEKVSAKDDLIEFVTDKATFNLPSPCSGVLVEILAPEGVAVKAGEVLGVIQEG